MSKTKQRLWTKFGGKEFFARMAENATNDGDGNEIAQTYATNDDLATKQNTLTFGYNSNNQIVSIDSHDLAPSTDSTVYLAHYTVTTGANIKAALNANKAVMSKSGNTDPPSFGLLGSYDLTNNKYQFTIIKKTTNVYDQAPGDINYSGVFCSGSSWFGQTGSLTFKAPTSAGQVMKSVQLSNGKYDWALSTINGIPSSTAADENKVLSVNSQGSPEWTALNRDVFGTVMLDENDIPVLDESSTPDNPVVVYDADSTDDLWTSFAGYEFGARRAYEDQDGNNIKATYARKDEASGLDEATEGEVDSIVITYGSVVIGGRTYKTVTIGNQEWLAENLDYKFEGLEIGEEDTLVKSIANYYDGDEATYGRYGNRYGLLYNWKAVDYIEQNKATLLPSDWHVPTETEWTTLLTAVGGASVAGEKLKSFSGWSSGNGDDPYGMSIYPCGDYSTVINEYENINVKTWFWTATESSASNNAKYVSFYTGDNAHQDSNPKSVGYSVRLVRTIS